MVHEAALLWSYLHVLNKRRYDALVEVFGSLEAAAPLIGESLLKQLGMAHDAVRTALLRREEFDPAAYAAQLKAKGIRFLTIEDDDYPVLLRKNSDPPVFLYAKGDLSILRQPCIGIVGTREMTAYGKRATETFVPAFVQAGMVTVSGLAGGIDTVVASETLHAGGKTVAVLGHGLSMIFPKQNEKLAEKILENGGLLLSEFPLDTDTSRLTFPARNRIIAGLSLGTVVIEAPVGSGALITAEFALEEGREVFAVPGSIFEETMAGSHALIASSRAKLAATPEEVLRDLGIVAPSQNDAPAYEPQTDDERAIYAVLTSKPQMIDAIVEASGIPPAGVSIALTMMELSGAARAVGGGKWVRA